MIRSIVAERNVRRIVFHVTQATAAALNSTEAPQQVLDTLTSHGFRLQFSVQDPEESRSSAAAQSTALPSGSTKSDTLNLLEAGAGLSFPPQLTDPRNLTVELSSESLRSITDLQQLTADALGLERLPSPSVRLFGSHLVSRSQVFHETDLSFCLVNLKPIVPGHVLVLPKRRVGRFDQLDADEVGDLWCTAQTVGTAVQRHYKASSLTFAIQDGPEAGQTVEHVHIHVLPRHKSDFDVNDDVYNEIESHERRLGMDNDDRRPRSLDAMAAEAHVLRELFK